MSKLFCTILSLFIAIIFVIPVEAADSGIVVVQNKRDEAITAELGMVTTVGNEKSFIKIALAGGEKKPVTAPSDVIVSRRILIRIKANSAWGPWFGRGVYEEAGVLVLDLP